MVKFDKATYLLFLLKLIFSIRLSISHDVRSFTISSIQKYSKNIVNFVLYLYQIHYVVIYCFIKFFCVKQRTFPLTDFIYQFFSCITCFYLS